MRILYIQYTNPAGYPPLEHSSRILAGTGWDVLFLGTGAFGASTLTFAPHPNVTVRQLRFCRPGLRQKIHYLLYSVWVLAWVVAWRPRWVYASDVLSCPIALALSMIPGLRIIYHEHDSPVAGAGSNRVVMAARRLLARCATCCILPNTIRAARFRADVGRSGPVVCIWNCPRKAEISEPRPPIRDTDLWLLYHGSITPERLPLSVLQALAKLPDRIKLRVIGYETAGSSGYLETLRATARDLRISHRVDALGSVPTRSTLLRHCRQSDIGLALVPMKTDDINMIAMAGASNKPFDYLACGLALVVSDLPEWRALYVEPGYGVACEPDDPASIDRAIRSLLRDPTELRAMGERGRRRVKREWNYEAQFAKVFESLNVPGPSTSRALCCLERLQIGSERKNWV